MTGKVFTGNSSGRKLFFYITYWLIYLIFFSVQRFFSMRYIMLSHNLDTGNALFSDSLMTNLFFLPAVILSSHFMVNFLVPRFYFLKRFYLFSILAGLTIILYPFFIYLLRILYVDHFYPNPEKYSIDNYFAAMLIFVFGLAPLAWYEIARHLRSVDEIRRRIDKDRLEALLKLKEAELKLLKSQLHPHFLFNTLNNLYALVIEKSDRAPDLIIRLSDMLSYIIYDCKSEKVELSKDIGFIKNYIEVQKVRFDNCNIRFTIKGDMDNKKIAPMILHTFIDNSFKHGAETDPGNPWIRIALTASDDKLFLTVINSMANHTDGDPDIEGIGITNTRKRLEMLYRDRHELVLQKTHDKFAVFLKMKL